MPACWHSCELALPDTELTEVRGVEPQWVSVTNVLGSVLLRAVCLWKTQPKTQKGTTPHADFRRREKGVESFGSLDQRDWLPFQFLT